MLKFWIINSIMRLFYYAISILLWNMKAKTFIISFDIELGIFVYVLIICIKEKKYSGDSFKFPDIQIYG